jgi:hypoxanthine-DNA glycosylase
MNTENLKLEIHPFDPFVPENSKYLIIGSFPGANTENDWYYGAKRNMFWKIISAVFETDLKTKEEKQRFCREQGIALTDIWLEVKRKNGKNLDHEIIVIKDNFDQIHDLLNKLRFKKVLFTSKLVQDKFLVHFPDLKNYECLPSPSGGANRPIFTSEEFKN